MKQTREFCPADRYVYDFGACNYKRGWAQMDTGQDAPYYGNWANPQERKLFSYCEGDTCLTECESAEEFAAEIRRTAQWHIENTGKFGIDAMCDPDMIAEFAALGLSDLLH